MDSSIDSILKTIFGILFVLVIGVSSCRGCIQASKLSRETEQLSSEAEQLERQLQLWKELDEKRGKGKLTPKEEDRFKELKRELELKFKELEELKK